MIDRSIIPPTNPRHTINSKKRQVTQCLPSNIVVGEQKVISGTSSFSLPEIIASFVVLKTKIPRVITNISRVCTQSCPPGHRDPEAAALYKIDRITCGL